MPKLILFMLMASMANAGTHIMQGDAAGGDLSGTYPNPTVNVSASPAGSDQQIQYNNSGAFGASSSLSWDDAGKVLTTGTPFISDAVTGYGIFIDQSKSGGLATRGAFVTQACGGTPPQEGIGVDIDLQGACTTSSSGMNVSNNATSPRTIGIQTSLTGASSISSIGWYTTVSGASASNTGLDISASGGTQNYGILVRGGQVQVNSSMTVTGAGGFLNTYGITTGSITINTGGSSGQTMCWKTATTLGYCSSVVGVGGACTCN